MTQNLHVKSTAITGHPRAQSTQTQHAQGQALQIPPHGLLPLRMGCSKTVHFLRQMPHDRQQQTPGQLRGGTGKTRRTAYHDIVVSGGLQIDRGIFQTRGNQQFQLWQTRQTIAAEWRTFTHGQHDVIGLKTRDERIRILEMRVVNIKPHLPCKRRKISARQSSVLIVIQNGTCSHSLRSR